MWSILHASILCDEISLRSPLPRYDYQRTSACEDAERHASGAANGRSEGRAEAIGGRLQAVVRRPADSALAATHLRHRRALQVSAHGQGARVELLQVSDGSLKIELTDMADNQSPNSPLLGNTTHDPWWSVKREGKSTGRICGNGEMHDQDMRSPREIDEPRVGAGLIGAKHDRHIVRVYAICQRWDIAVGYAQRGHGDSLLIEHR